jgi:uncharacterized repeat protein (TIGR03943 family)
VNRQAQAVLLLLFGGAILKASMTDLYLRYVKEGLRPFLLVAGAALIVAAVMTLWYDLRPARAVQTHPQEGHDDGHGHHEPRVGWLLMLPALGLILVAPPALGAYTASQAGAVPISQPADAVYPSLPPGDPAPISLLDYASRAVFDQGRSLTGRNLQLTGFITPAPDGSPLLTRIVLTCCAADGRPIKVGLTGDTVIDAPAGTWVNVVGAYNSKVGKDPVNKSDLAYLTVQQWQQITPPKKQYE